MLCYLGSGTRHYAEKPVRAYRRPYWEFQAVLSGRIAMQDETGTLPLRRNHLWLSAPGHLHGWTGEPGKSAEIAVFQFLRIPEPLAKKIPEKTRIEIALTVRQTERLRHLRQVVGETLERPGPEMLLRHEHALLELSLLIYEADPSLNETGEDAARTRVQKALDWFSANLQANPSLDEVAQSAGSSASHLRRHFHEVLEASPKKIFDQLRFHRAMQMMADPDMKLSTVCEACGFESASAFSRAFKTKFGVSPDHWRGRKTSSQGDDS